MIAMLGMYDMPALQAANDRFWTLIRNHLGYGPDHLTRDQDMWGVWQDPNLILAQTCGMPYRTRLHGHVQLVGTPDYGLPDCPAGHYNSVFVKRRDDTRDLTDLTQGTFAYNEAVSQSGWAAPITHLAQLNLRPAAVLETGGHALSAQAVAEGKADFAALDALTWHLLQEYTDQNDRLQEVTRTVPTPTLPYITAQGQNAAQIALAVRAAIEGLEDTDRQQLSLRGLVDIQASDYLAVPNPPTPNALLSNS
ncbi:MULTISPECIES: PhnD/SsuA/transferrin family substrate-binding protein [unclassified Ruegeria]|uniref:PhnD/SsuA/transferrin family substrate-binding protein n=1 Tax=unclassified Ruegeria TaxID=2625375 RepID=UPI001487FC48|nr:PhnD/SsuA/transferrin family substrate-binding protein [Ruegeria sp. HKCCD7296]NOD45823.1 PhnD/SsuA/transferrin family substrate-binding protein [Ruegeria sp. HKCCD5849]NOD50877.1 PhnD/SsuA/transferrin family substrate-binding protein [Ruegeria sp. HKCCD5851]NOD67684.1 PhnD/SsuA/transferrin family substrate-binding protein [Ruegeria sp. HKCCD7303]NOE33261.1 PhnD/SsuA/transferrin family substrate-binding protein [Ruegeria sp. HKCCD7318]NOE40465.1 PhnD/SsuA/transferrin family substrate-bindin